MGIPCKCLFDFLKNYLIHLNAKHIIMNNQRRLFLSQMSLVAGVAALSKPMDSMAAISKRLNSLYKAKTDVTIYHTNDLHGNINAAYNNIGGLDQIKNLLQSQETSGLLLDAGDLIDGANSLEQQKKMIYAMNATGYHAAAIGNHELALGQDHLAALVPLMQFALVNCNYRFDSALSRLVKPYVIINSGQYKIGITGVGHKVKGVVYNDAILCANQTAKLLKEKENCDVVICLSHLGYQQKDNEPDNKALARASNHIDMIISGHNRKLLSGQLVMLNKQKQEVLISHAAWNGLMMGKTTFRFSSGKQKSNIDARYLIPGQPYGQKFAASFAGLRLMEKQLISA